MSGRCLHRVVRVQLSQALTKSYANTPRRHVSSVRLTLRPSEASEQLPTPPLPPSASPSSSSSSYTQEAHWVDLKSALGAEVVEPDMVWTAYTSLVNVGGTFAVPLVTHQHVLRTCVPSVTTRRVDVARSLHRGKLPVLTDQYEHRLRSVVHNINSIGHRPTLDDLNFVLGHFAAVGHYQGCWEVYQESKRLGHTPTQTTFAYCSQSIAQRLTLPIHKSKRENLLEEVNQIFSTYMADMREYNIHMNAVTFDLSVRILKETLDAEGFEHLMKWGYGIDLSNPDRIALEFLERSKASTDGAPVSPFPFTTTALNTTLDVLGRLGNLSKMVAAFEVLTQPLPTANQHFFNSFDSGDEDDFGVQVNSSSAPQTAWAVPNTTSYSILLRYLCRADNATLARHYINQVRKFDREVSHNLRNNVQSLRKKRQPLEQLASPNIRMTPAILLPVLGEANKDKNMALLRWMQNKMPFHIRTCKVDLDYYTQVLEQLRKEQYQFEEVSPPKSRDPSATPVLELNVDDPSETVPTVVKPFNIVRHVAVLERTHRDLVEFGQRLDFIIRRTSERIKERLGRRIWEGKDIYLVGMDRRVVVSKEKWKDMVNFKPKAEEWEYRANQRPWKAPWTGVPTKKKQNFDKAPSYMHRPPPPSEPQEGQ